MLHMIDGVFCGGEKRGKIGVGIIVCEGKIAAVYTKNKIKAAPIKFNLQNLSEDVRGIIVNSGNANAFTGEEGVRRAKMMAEFLASKLNCEVSKVAVASTGVIGKQLEIEEIIRMGEDVFNKLGNDENSSLSFAKAIMTTDRFPKMAYWENEVKIAGVAKGAGMISPNMATMLAFIVSDADLQPRVSKRILRRVVDRTFNQAVVDGDTSTNDTVFLVTTGEKKVSERSFEEMLERVCGELAKQIVRDGEGAKKLLLIKVTGARNNKEAFKAAKTIASSLLVKTAFFGEDPNFGRIVAALGYSGIDVDERISIAFKSKLGEVKVVERGEVVMDEAAARKILSAEEIEVLIDLHKGNGKGCAFGCDLGYEYVRINSEYTT